MKDYADITIVLDRSGSMESVKSDTIGGFNAFVDEQRGVPGEALLTLCQFDTTYDVVYAGRPLAEVPRMTEQTFVPRGSTALLDAMGRTILEMGSRFSALPESERPEQVLLVVMTDGQENSSHEFTRDQIFARITHQREIYGWQIAFIGANQDAIATGTSLGIMAANNLSYAATPAGTSEAIDKLSKAAASYRRRKVKNTADFFDPDDTNPSPS